MSLRDVKEKIRSIDRTRKVTKAMETVSAVKMRKSQLRAFTSRPYARAALSILERLSPSLAVTKHPLTVARTVNSIALVVVTSDKGLCGVLNSAVLRKCEAVIAESGLQKENILIYAFGKKAAEYFDRRGYTIKSRMENISDEVPLDELATVSAQLTTAFLLLTAVADPQQIARMDRDPRFGAVRHLVRFAAQR